MHGAVRGGVGASVDRARRRAGHRAGVGHLGAGLSGRYADLRSPTDATRRGRLLRRPHHVGRDAPPLEPATSTSAAAPAAATDMGAIGVAMRSDVMVETGTFEIEGRDVPYVEVWHRLRGSDGRVVETTEPNTTPSAEVGVHAPGKHVDDRMRRQGLHGGVPPLRRRSPLSLRSPDQAKGRPSDAPLGAPRVARPRRPAHRGRRRAHPGRGHRAARPAPPDRHRHHRRHRAR